MNDESAQGALSRMPGGRPQESTPAGLDWEAAAWTAADAAELDCLLWELAGSYQEHRQKCRACRPEPCLVLAAYRAHAAECWKCEHGIKVATSTYGEPCWIRQHWLAHGDSCVRCNPCPHLQNAIAIVLDWRQARQLLTRAEELRIDRAVQALELADVVAEAES